MATNTSDFFTFSKTAGTAKNLQKPTDGGDNNLWGGYINVDLDTIVGAVNATSDLIADANQNELVDFTATGSAVNHVGITNAATGNGPTIEAKGDDTNIDLNVSGKGTGKLATTSPKITTGINDSNNNELIKVTATGSAVNEITVANAATGNGPTLSATGDDTNIDLNIVPKGSGNSVFTNKISADDIVEKTSAHGVEIDGVLLKDGGATFTGSLSGVSGRLISVTYISNDSTSTASTGNYTKPAGCTALKIILTGGGGAGAGFTSGGETGGGGGAGATTIAYVTESSSSYFASKTAGSGTIAYHVGYGGASSGSSGAYSWFGESASNYLALSEGGYGGNANGTASGTAVASVGSGAYAPASSLLLKGGKGTSEFGDGSSNVKTGGKGGASYWGEGGSGANENAGGGENADVYGTGGGGASGNGNGGSGLGGVLVIYAFT